MDLNSSEHPATKANEPKLSKNQQKKLLKLKLLEERKSGMRKAQREKRKIKNALAREQGIERTGPTRKELKKIQKQPADIIVAIDLSFDELMTEKDLGSCSKQLLRIYTSNRRGKNPIPLHFTSLNENGKLYEKMQRHDGWKAWNVQSHEESFIELFDQDKIVYLTSDSDNVLQELEKGIVYVIGGLVDHNHHKNLTHELAKKNSIRTARLPLSENLILKTRSVLTINQVFDIILGVSDGGSWKEVLMQALPQRKNIKLREEDDVVQQASSGETKESVPNELSDKSQT